MHRKFTRNDFVWWVRDYVDITDAVNRFYGWHPEQIDLSSTLPTVKITALKSSLLKALYGDDK